MIGEEIVRDPTSAIAQAAEIRAKSGGAIMPFWMRMLMPLACAAVLSVIDWRRRPGLAGAGYGVVVLAFYGWSASTSPAYAPLVPSVLETALAVVIAAIAGAAGARLGRRLGGALATSGTPAEPGVARDRLDRDLVVERR